MISAKVGVDKSNEQYSEVGDTSQVSPEVDSKNPMRDQSKIKVRLGTSTR